MFSSTTRTYILQAVLFIATFFSTTFCGALWTGHYELSGWNFFWSGLDYAVPFLGILTIHEMGHYICARKYGVETTLPYYIPVPIPQTIGTLGAFIQMKSQVFSKRAVFDIGIAGPLAGFVAALLLLIYGFTHLPPREYIYKIHPEYALYGANYEQQAYSYAHLRAMDSLHFVEEKKQEALFRKKEGKSPLDSATAAEQVFKPQEAYTELFLGDNLLFLILSHWLVDDLSLVPNEFELFHYPFLFAGYLALFFTALNLLPVGQLDGGHVVYGLFGYRRHRIISVSVFTAFVLLAGIGIFKDNVLGINFFTADPLNMLLFAAAYLYFLYSMYERFFEQQKMTAILLATGIFATQFLVEFVLPDWHGFSGWMVFAYVVGRFLGLAHPPALQEQPLDVKRKVLGWLALAIFVLCFTPEIFQFKTITP